MTLTEAAQGFVKTIDAVAVAFRLDPAKVAQEFFESVDGLDHDRAVVVRSAANHVIMREHDAHQD